MFYFFLWSFFFFFNDTATTEIYTLSLHDALPIYHELTAHRDANRPPAEKHPSRHDACEAGHVAVLLGHPGDRKSTRLNSSHLVISYAVFCLKKKKQTLLLIRILHTPSASQL